MFKNLLASFGAVSAWPPGARRARPRRWSCRTPPSGEGRAHVGGCCPSAPEGPTYNKITIKVGETHIICCAIDIPRNIFELTERTTCQLLDIIPSLQSYLGLMTPPGRESLLWGWYPSNAGWYPSKYHFFYKFVIFLLKKTRYDV